MNDTITHSGCSCECSQGGFCGGCGHAGCGRRVRANRDRFGFAWTPQALARADARAPWASAEDDE